MADVFISYSRQKQNSDFAHRLTEELSLKGKNPWVDWKDIPLTSPNWWHSIKVGIEEADGFVFIMSPDSMASVVCNMELDYAIELRKRIVPVVFQEVVSKEAFASVADFKPDDAMRERLEGKDPLMIARSNWQRLSHINWVFFRDSDNFDRAFESLIKTVETDLDYVRAHTRYLTRAKEWAVNTTREDLLLFGQEIDRAENWLRKGEVYANATASNIQNKVDVVNPLPTKEHRIYITASRAAETERQQRLSALERARLDAETASAESLVQAERAEQARKRARRTLSAVAIASVVLIIAAIVLANSQINTALQEVVDANIQVDTAQGKADAANTQVADAQSALSIVSTEVAQGEARIESLRLAALANTELQNGNPYTATLLGIRALSTAYTAQADAILLAALRQSRVNNIRTFTRHSDAVNSAVYSPDGLHIVTASTDETAIVWDAATGERLRTLVGHIEIVNSAVYSPNGNYIVTASNDGTAIIWDAATGEKLRTLVGHTHFVNSAVYSPNGNYIVTASNDGTAIIWDAATGEKLRILSGQAHTVTGATYNPDGRNIVTTDSDSTAIIWDAATGEKLRILSGHAFNVTNATYSPDGRYIVTTSYDSTAIIWDAATGEKLIILVDHTDVVWNAVYSPDGRFIATSSADKSVIIWDAATGEKLRILSGHTSDVNGVAYSPDGLYIVTASGDETVIIWDANYQTFIDHACERIAIIGDFTEGERLRLSLDNSPTCPQFAAG